MFNLRILRNMVWGYWLIHLALDKEVPDFCEHGQVKNLHGSTPSTSHTSCCASLSSAFPYIPLHSFSCHVCCTDKRCWLLHTGRGLKGNSIVGRKGGEVPSFFIPNTPGTSFRGLGIVRVKPVGEPGYFVASWWRTPLRHSPKVTIDQ
jgi:hypothetical protein